MTESEWLASTDPRAMVEAVRGKASNRKLRLFVLAVSWLIGPTKDQSGLLKARANAERMAEGDVPGQWSEKFWVDNPNAIGAAQQAVWSQSPRMAAPIASLLRDIVGNPFRVVTLVACNCGACVAPGKQHHNGPCAVRRLRTPTVLSLAQAAYDHRLIRPHKRCECGTAYEMLNRKSTPPLAWCPRCRKDGGWYFDAVAKDEGHLDPYRLAVLADALEEAGCKRELCQECGGSRRIWVDYPPVEPHWNGCHDCDCGLDPQSFLGHLRSPGPHVRGCWAVDLILGKE